MALELDEQYYAQGYKLIVGCDEAGRGCLLGPVFAAAVIWPQGLESPLINDSKKKNAIAYGIASVSADEIDEVNIYNASRMAMQRAIENMKHDFDLVLTDAMKMPNYPKPVVDIIHGDAQSMCIAAASILAKVSRDRLCLELDKDYPQYNIKKNKGYGTKDHLEALKEYGPVKHLHRFTYAPVRACFIEKVSLF